MRRAALRSLTPKVLSPRFRWLSIGALWVVATILSYTGLSELSRVKGDRKSTLDLVYSTVKVFTFGAPDGVGGFNWRLEVARFLGPAVAGSAILTAFAALFKEQLAQARLRFTRGHVIVAGLGDTGARIAAGFADKGQRVVAIERDPGCKNIASAKRKGVHVIIGNAADGDQLRVARIDSASRLVVTCGDDGTNAQVAALARDAERGRTNGPLTCSVHLRDPQLCRLLRHQGLRQAATGLRTELFNVFQQGARLWVTAWPPAVGARPPHLVMVGLGPLSDALIVAAVQQADDLLRVTLVGSEAGGRLQGFRLRHPSLFKYADISALDIDFDAPDAEEVDRFHALMDDGHPTAVYICFEDETRSLSVGLEIAALLRGSEARVVLRTRSHAGVALLLSSSGASENVSAFPLLDRTCTAEMIEGGIHEELARAIHSGYLSRSKSGSGLARPWEELSDQERESSRTAADHLAAGLIDVGCDLVPIDQWNEAAFAFSDEEVEVLARREHERWRAERELQGWRYGPVRDDATTRNPMLVPWDELDEEARDANRETARELPHLLARAGFEIVRLRD